MTQQVRKTPTLGSIASLFTGNANRVDHEKLVNDALNLFDEAQAKMNSASKAIDEQVKLDEEEIKTIEKRIADQHQSKDRLTRTIQRLKALTE